MRPAISLAPLAALLLHLASEPAPNTLLRKAVANSAESKAAVARFTYFDLEHNQNRNRKGKLYADTLTLYEDTYIADLPYKRVVEYQGRPLTGSALSAERARYDAAVAERRGLDAAARANLAHVKMLQGHLDLPQLLTPAYRLTELRTEVLRGIPVHVLQATPVPSPTSAPSRALELWIDPVGPNILRLTYDVVADEPDMLHGSHAEEDFQVLDGIAVPSHSVIHFFYPHGGDTITVDVEHTYTRYRRFSTSVRILSPDDASTPRNGSDSFRGDPQ